MTRTLLPKGWRRKQIYPMKELCTFCITNWTSTKFVQNGFPISFQQSTKKNVSKFPSNCCKFLSKAIIISLLGTKHGCIFLLFQAKKVTKFGWKRGKTDHRSSERCK